MITDVLLDDFLLTERPHMLEDLKRILIGAQLQMRRDPDLYTEHGTTEPTIDIRLCIDHEWIFRTGDASYDQIHSDLCAASCIGLDSTAETVLADLVGQL
jgi:hypothetical protein